MASINDYRTFMKDSTYTELTSTINWKMINDLSGLSICEAGLYLYIEGKINGEYVYFSISDIDSDKVLLSNGQVLMLGEKSEKQAELDDAYDEGKIVLYNWEKDEINQKISGWGISNEDFIYYNRPYIEENNVLTSNDDENVKFYMDPSSPKTNKTFHTGTLPSYVSDLLELIQFINQRKKDSRK